MILCIDIGLKNLAMCALDPVTKEIKLWETFNTLDPDASQEICKGVTKAGKLCGKKCGYKYTGTDQVVNYSCKSHFPKEIPMHQSNIIKAKLVKDFLLQDIAKIVINQIKHVFHTYSDVTHAVTKVIIELQPRMNNKMSFTSHLIYGKLVELYSELDPNIPIRFVKASQKLKAYKGPSVSCNLKSSYAKRKYLGVEYVKWILQNEFPKQQCEIWYPLFLQHAKKDDLADTLLMAINGVVGSSTRSRTTQVKGTLRRQPR